MNRKNGSKSRSDVRESLLKRQQELLILLDGQRGQLNGHQDGADLVDDAFEEIANTIGSELIDIINQELLLVELALQKVSDGIYGKCEACNKKISKTRLSIVPYATLCARCQKKAEGGNHHYSRKRQFKR